MLRGAFESKVGRAGFEPATFRFLHPFGFISRTLLDASLRLNQAELPALPSRFQSDRNYLIFLINP